MRSGRPRAPASRIASASWSTGCCKLKRSEPRQVRELLLRGVHVHAPELGAAIESRDGLPGIQEAVLVERALHGVEELELRGAELHAHVVHFFDADAVLAGDRAANRDRE